MSMLSQQNLQEHSRHRLSNEFCNLFQMVFFDKRHLNEQLFNLKYPYFHEEQVEEEHQNFTYISGYICGCGHRKKLIKKTKWRTHLCNEPHQFAIPEKIKNVISISNACQYQTNNPYCLQNGEEKQENEEYEEEANKECTNIEKEEIKEEEKTFKVLKLKEANVNIAIKEAEDELEDLKPAEETEKNENKVHEETKEEIKVCAYCLTEFTQHCHNVYTTVSVPDLEPAFPATTPTLTNTFHYFVDKSAENHEKRTFVNSFINVIFNFTRKSRMIKYFYHKQIVNCHFYRCKNTTKLATKTTLTKSKLKRNSKAKINTSTRNYQRSTTKTILLAHYITHLIYTLPRLYLIVILLLSLLTAVKHANCQQQQQQHQSHEQQQQELFISRKTNTITQINSQSHLLFSSNTEKIVNNNSKNNKQQKTQPNDSYHVQNIANNSHNNISNNDHIETSNHAVYHHRNHHRKLNHSRNLKLVKNYDKLINYEHRLIVFNNIIYNNDNQKPKANIHSNDQKRTNNNIHNNNKSNINNSNITINFINIQTLAKNNLSQKVAIDQHVNTGNKFDLNIDDDNDDFYDIDEEDDDAKPNRFTNNEDNQKLMRLVMNGLGLKKLPDMEKVNISQQEYATKYREYLRRVHERKRRELAELTYAPAASVVTSNRHKQWRDDWSGEDEEGFDALLHIVSIVTNDTNDIMLEQKQQQRKHIRKREKRNSETLTPNSSANLSGQQQKQKRFARYSDKTKIFLHFPLNANNATQALQSGDIEEANIRLMLIHSPALAYKHNNNNNKKNNNNARRGGQCGGGSHHKPVTPRLTKQVLNLKVYQLLSEGKRLWLDGRKIDIVIAGGSSDETHSQWLQFDVTKAVEAWLSERHTNFGLEVQCDNCQRVGARILNELYERNEISSEQSENGGGGPYEVNGDTAEAGSEGDEDDQSNQLMPVLNIIGRLNGQQHELHTHKHASPSSPSAGTTHHNATPGGGGGKRRTSHQCYKANQRCCRHTMEVIFKEIKGFEFIIQPKVFDAGYCHGRCPPRYNPAHHHAMLQSLVWKQSRRRAPRPCCAPSKLVELEVLHVDEKDSEKLKISTWTDMRVVECACS